MVSLLTAVLLIMSRTLFSLAAASAHCLDSLILSCIITPKSFSSSVSLILMLSISYSDLQFFLHTCMTAHLFMLNGMFQSFDHLCSFSKSPRAESFGIFLIIHPCAKCCVVSKLGYFRHNSFIYVVDI